jgi:hypothetical protein
MSTLKQRYFLALVVNCFIKIFDLVCCFEMSGHATFFNCVKRESLRSKINHI